MGNAVVHFEVMGTDLDELARFYGELFGWSIQTMPEMNYSSVDTTSGAGINGGLGVAQDGSRYVTFYIEVPDTDAALAEIEKAGGKTITPTVVMENIVTFAHFADPAGNRVGLVKAGEGPGVSEGSNPEVGWFEVLGADADALAKFYTEQFGWKTKRSETDQFIYHEVDTGSGKGSAGGIGASPDGKPYCTVYAGVEDVTKTLERAEALGGKITMPETKVAEETVIGQFADPQGNVFGVYRSMPR